ncbi:MFS transporter [Cupriavidus basilensis]
MNAALISAIFPPHRLGRGVGLNALVVGVSLAVGPTVASIILSLGPWPWLFAVNLPIGLLALYIAWPALPQTVRGGASFRPCRRGAERGSCSPR